MPNSNYVHRFSALHSLKCLAMLALMVSMNTLAAKSDNLHSSIAQHATEINDELISLRRDLHQHPELSGNELRTEKMIAEYLRALGLDVITGIGGHSVVAKLDTGKAGKHIGWRADIDAIAVKSHNDLPFSSVNKGVGHHCGHDVHTAIALGMANVLASLKESLSGTYVFVFQPAEEDFSGAKSMITAGVFDTISLDEFYAAHISPMPSGVVASKPGYLYADYKQVNLTFDALANNEALIATAKQTILDLQTVAADSPIWDTKNLMDPQIGLGHPQTVFQNYRTVDNYFKVEHNGSTVTVSGFVSSSNPGLMEAVIPALSSAIAQTDFASNLQAITFNSEQVGFSTERPNINNHPQLTRRSLNTLSELYPEAAIPLYGVVPDGRGDDFASFQQQVPGTYFFLGGSDFSKGIIAMPHADNFRVDESTIGKGVKYFSSLLAERAAAASD
ncbi:M20 metallopeptidase family protein [Alteromonas gilva]|uniref:Amidohydrolase n=1 Tax=Alteromonas gilva TaxID=2987522 RepID=A0ABT5L2H9_9ALTE|nr:amidohydrolase [Alteromonas gilva]MDC8830601.1 amidohydrolase [Alteromonas gilva]